MKTPTPGGVPVKNVMYRILSAKKAKKDILWCSSAELNVICHFFGGKNMLWCSLVVARLDLSLLTSENDVSREESGELGDPRDHLRNNMN